VSIRLPAVDVTVSKQTGFFTTTATNGLPVWFVRGAANGCPATTVSETSATDPQRGGNGKLLNPGLPFGTYLACASATDTNGKTHYDATPATFTLNSWTAPAVTVTVDVRTTTTTNTTLPTGC
jgi:hypothetical protein